MSNPFTTEPAGGAPAPTPGTAGLANDYMTAYDTAWYDTRSPEERALYYGRAGVVIPEGASQLTIAQYKALYEHLCANPPKTPDGKVRPLVHAIAGWGWGPYEANFDANLQGVNWWPPDEGDVVGTEVITKGEFSGPPPATPHTVVTLNIADLLAGGSIGPWPSPAAPAPVVVSDLVGREELPGEYATNVHIGPNTPYPVGAETTDARGKFKVIVKWNMFGPTYLWTIEK